MATLYMVEYTDKKLHKMANIKTSEHKNKQTNIEIYLFIYS